jgi:hypothetical protein
MAKGKGTLCSPMSDKIGRSGSHMPGVFNHNPIHPEFSKPMTRTPVLDIKFAETLPYGGGNGKISTPMQDIAPSKSKIMAGKHKR